MPLISVCFEVATISNPLTSWPGLNSTPLSVTSSPFSRTALSVHPGGRLPARSRRRPDRPLSWNEPSSFAVAAPPPPSSGLSMSAGAAVMRTPVNAGGVELPSNTIRPEAAAPFDVTMTTFDRSSPETASGKIRRLSVAAVAAADRGAEHHRVAAIGRHDPHRTHREHVVTRRDAVEREVAILRRPRSPGIHHRHPDVGAARGRRRDHGAFERLALRGHHRAADPRQAHRRQREVRVLRFLRNGHA